MKFDPEPKFAKTKFGVVPVPLIETHRVYHTACGGLLLFQHSEKKNHAAIAANIRELQPMSALGHKQTSRSVSVMSALAPIADMSSRIYEYTLRDQDGSSPQTGEQVGLWWYPGNRGSADGTGLRFISEPTPPPFFSMARERPEMTQDSFLRASISGIG